MDRKVCPTTITTYTKKSRTIKYLRKIKQSKPFHKHLLIAIKYEFQKWSHMILLLRGILTLPTRYIFL